MAIKTFVTDFKKFINKGNIIDLATGIIIGSSFTAIVNSLVNDIVMPCISKLIKFDLTSAYLLLSEAIYDEDGEIVKKAITLNYGNFIQTVITFLVVAFSIFITLKVIKAIRANYIKHEVRYIKNLKKKHPELFDEEDEFGTKLYDKLKNEHPEYFKTDEVNVIEEKKQKALEKTPQELNNELLVKINNNLELINKNLNENADK
jgi:large conductance mechanosensitive channel